MAKAKNKIKVSFPNMSSVGVTGSSCLIEMDNYTLLVEHGLHQNNSIKSDHKINSEKPPFKVKDIDFVFVLHNHIDHIGKIPMLYKQGADAKIIAPEKTYQMFKTMLLDSAHIANKDAELLNRKYHMNVEPLYSNDDVNTAMEYYEEYPFGEIIEINPQIKFRFTNSGHILQSAQLELWLTQNNSTTKKIYISSDLGSNIPKYYVKPLEPVKSANLAICESTYSSAIRQVYPRDKKKDIEKIKTVIRNVCCEQRGKVLIPAFAADRTQNIATVLYDIFGKDESFRIPIYIDSPLAEKITKLYLGILEGDDLKKLKDVLAWDNIKFVNSYTDSLALQTSKEPLVVISASGMLSAGRSVSWARNILPSSKSHIIFIGFSAEGSLAGRIRDSRKNKTITVDGKAVANRCGVTSLLSFSSHIQHDSMLKYYSDMNVEKIALVHSEYKSRCEFAKELQDEISRKNKSGKVIIVNKSTKILL
ncbi:MAG: MBL fold metallo-hydrolase [Candidatus Pacebacteria bacterium]|nr:MBL fold metallo-hydrolase [Candidatus Paceibacterota bacterium]